MYVICVCMCVGGCGKEERGSVRLGHVRVEISPHTHTQKQCSGLQVYQHMHVRITGVA